MTTDHCHEGHHHHGGGEHAPADGSGRRLAFALAIIAGFAVVEIAGGLMSRSLALIADAGHMVTDAAALALALSAQWLAARPVSDRFPFGWKRAQVLAAFVNGLGLVAVVGFLVAEAIGRLGSPLAIDAPLMLSVAVIGLGANIAAFFILHPRAEGNLNVRGAMLHVAADIFGSVAAIVSALVILATGYHQVDAILTLLVCGLILRSTLPLLREAGGILMQAAPPGLDVEDLRASVLSIPSIIDVHRLRAWQLVPGETMIAFHVVTETGADRDAVLVEVEEMLRDRYGISQSTLQIETANVVALGSRLACAGDRDPGVEVAE